MGGMRVKLQLRKGVWPHLVRVFHPALETREERESYLSKLRLIYDALKGRLQLQNFGNSAQSHHLYESIRRDAVRTDPCESFYTQQQEDLNRSSSGPYLNEGNIEKLVNITAVFTLEHEEVAYTQGMTDLLSPILYVMEREDDAYIVFAAMVQRISENFGTWCEGTLKKVERLRHLCSVLDPQLAAYLAGIEEDAFALFFGMVLIECRREFSFGDSFHLMEVIWAAALCMRQIEDPNWSPPSVSSPVTRNGARIQVSTPGSEISEDLDSAPSHSEWASFMSNRSPDVIRQVFGELQTYTAVPLTPGDSLLSYSLPQNPTLTHSLTSLGNTSQISREERQSGGIFPPVQTNSSPCEAHSVTIIAEIESESLLETPMECRAELGKGGEDGGSGEHAGDGNETNDDEAFSSCSSLSRESQTAMQENVAPHSMAPVRAVGERMSASNSPEKERSQSDPVHVCTNTFTNGVNSAHTEGLIETNERCHTPSTNAEEIPVRGKMAVLPNGTPQRGNSLSESELSSIVSPRTPPPLQTILKRTQTEMSDMSSVASTNASSGNNGRGTLVVSWRSGSSHGRTEEGEREGGRGGGEGEEGEGERSERREGEEGGEEGRLGQNVREGEDEGDCGLQKKSEGLNDEEDDDQWLVLVPEAVGEGQVTLDPDTENCSPTPNAKDGTAHLTSDGTHVTSSTVDQNGHAQSVGRDTELDLSDIHNSLHSRNYQLSQPVLQDSRRLVRDTPHHTDYTETNNNNPSAQTGMTNSTFRERSLTGERGPTFSPIQPFFDTLETLASTSRPTSPGPATERARPSSTLSAVITNLLSMEQSAPAVTRESSLTVPFSDSFPLFICLSIIIQHRAQILHGNLDFVGLSVLLNTQAGCQNLDLTLRIARQLYAKYREYQRMCFGPRFAVYEVWLDNMGTLFDGPQLHNVPRQGHEEEQTAG